jgi:hypothetical protein
MAEENEATPQDDGIRLDGLGDVQRELAKVYRDMRKGRIEISDGNGLTLTLVHLGKVMEQGILSAGAARLERLERRREEARRDAHSIPSAH